MPGGLTSRKAGKENLPMSGILIHLPSAHRTEPTTTRRLGPGETARFGRGTKAHPVELLLPDPAVSRLAGEIQVTEDHWQLTNFSTTHSYLVENPEGAGEYLRVPPRRSGRRSRSSSPGSCCPPGAPR